MVNMAPALTGLRVLDFGQFVAGPLCGWMLAEMGAEVIRVERPGGAPDRFIQPIRAELPGGAVYMQLNQRKTSLALDAFDPAARSMLDALLMSSDIVIANAPARTLDAMGLTWPRLAALNPRLILATTSAFGPGALADQSGFDGVGQAMSGAMHMTGCAGEPRKAYAHYVDYLTAALSAFGIVAALRTREVTGRGQTVETSLLGSALLPMAANLIEEAVLHPDRVGTGNRAQLAAPADTYATQDGHVLLQVIGNGMFRRCANMVGRREWESDARFANDEARGHNGGELNDAMSAWCAARTTAECLSRFAEAGLSAAPVLKPAAVLSDPDLLAGGFWSEDNGLPLFKLPISLGEPAYSPPRPAPSLGQGSGEILASLARSTATPTNASA